MNHAAPMELPATPAEAAQLRSALFLVGAGYLLLTLCDSREGLANLALRYLLKDELRLTATQMATFFVVIKLAWYCKPLAGLLTDHRPLLGTRRRGYLVVFSVMAAVLWAALAFAPVEYGALLWLVLLLNFALMIAHAALGGVLVEAGQTFRATGRISAVRSGVESFGWLITGLGAGWIAVRFGQSSFILAAALMALMAAMFARMMREEPAGAPTAGSAPLRGRLREIFRSPALWAAASFWVLVKFSPGFGTPLFYHQSEALKFSPQSIGQLGFVSAIAGLLGSIVYLRLCRRVALQRLLWLGVSLHAVAALAYFGYGSLSAAVSIEALYGLCTALALMPIFDLLARATPRDGAALGYAIIFSLGSLSVSGSDLAGAWLYERLGRSFTGMILLNSATSASVLLALPLLPRALLSARDAEDSPRT